MLARADQDLIDPVLLRIGQDRRGGVDCFKDVIGDAPLAEL